MHYINSDYYNIFLLLRIFFSFGLCYVYELVCCMNTKEVHDVRDRLVEEL